jgi:DNA invertase Pin-like site-specific DNA recombinase
MKIGYARTSTADQQAGLDAQLAELQQLGCDKIFSEQVSSVARRDHLNAALDYLRDGDTLVVTRLDRLARSVPDLLTIIQHVRGKDASIRDPANLRPAQTTPRPASRAGVNDALARCAFHEREGDAGAAAPPEASPRQGRGGQVQGPSADCLAARATGDAAARR